ncbi:MAG: transferrin-binding protein-like solute binding protein [Nitrospira sp. SB0666_bin_27]|nr:transferrin-binding protein-like solute binding protein [Nitrospira sp. SB0666_bin_27]MYF24664.1 transferrin-binding protein-like solute binding protein [Nitrospira sp. SB0678_bin_10]
MQKHRVTMVVMAGWIMALSGCLGSGGSLPDIPIPELMPEPQPFQVQTSLVDGVFSVTVPTEDGRTRTLNTIRDVEDTYGRFLPRPVRPNHSSREWLLVDNHYDGRVLLYAVVDWDNADTTDYLAAGWWLAYPPNVPVWGFEAATRGVFLDGPELNPANPPDLPLTGTATYVGGMGGLYTYQYGRNWGELADASEIAEFAGTVLLTADFDQNRLTGCMGCVEPIEIAPRTHLFAVIPRGTPDPAALPADYDLHFEASFGANGAFEDTAITVMHPDRTITNYAGTWQGQFSNVPDVDGNPRRVVGSTDVHFAEDDGSQGRFTGIFDALTPPTFTPPDDNGVPTQ